MVPAADFPPPAAFIHLPFNHTFLAFWQDRDAQVQLVMVMVVVSALRTCRGKS